MKSYKNKYSHLTAKERDKMSFPTRILMERDLLKGYILDFGCGFGKDVEELKNKDYDIEGYDPYYQPEIKREKYDTIICNYVLNVLQVKEQAKVLFEVSRLLKLGGKAYFTVRRDVKKEGFRQHFVHKKYTYQCNVTLPFKSIFQTENLEIYEYQHYTSINKSSKSRFLIDNTGENQIGEMATCFAIYDKYPVNKGHALIIPKREESDYFQLTFKEQAACWFLVNMVKEYLVSNFKPDGFNIGINSGKVAGQTVDHCHIHLIPRYENDMKDPTGGVRGVIPEKRVY